MKTPLHLLPPEERARRLAHLYQELDEDDSPIPIGLTPAEKLAARHPGLPASEETHMNPETPGFFTSEFWLKLLAGAAIAFLTWFTVSGGALDQIAALLTQSGNPLLVFVVPLAKAAVFGFCAWALQKLAEKYAAGRTLLKTTVLQLRARATAELEKKAA